MNQLQIGDVIAVAGVTLIPVENIIIYSDMESAARWWYGSKELYALVINASTGPQAFDKDAQEMNLSDLISNLPQLEKLLSL